MPGSVDFGIAEAIWKMHRSGPSSMADAFATKAICSTQYGQAKSADSGHTCVDPQSEIWRNRLSTGAKGLEAAITGSRPHRVA